MTNSSVDPDEVVYYEKLGSLWWDKDGVLWPLHKLNHLRTDFLKQAICEHFNLSSSNSEPLKGLSVLDIGCGGGILSESMAGLGASVHGIDVTEKNITVALQHSEIMQLDISYEHITAEALVDRNQHYDVVLNMEVVEHVANLEGFMTACSRLVSQDGIMFVSTINRTWKSWLFAIVGAEYILRWLPRGTHHWKKFVTPRELEHIFDANTMQTARHCGVRVNPLTKKFSLCQSLSVNYMLAATSKNNLKISRSSNDKQ